MEAEFEKASNCCLMAEREVARRYSSVDMPDLDP
jgi:hypothetical protein